MDIHQVTDVEILQHLADQPLGSAELQQSADYYARQVQIGNMKQSDLPSDLQETIKRTSKLWLPQGKKATRTREALDAEREILARNFDLEDAVEAAGGQRGSIA